MTPREVFSCIEFWQERERLLNYRAGLAPSATYNVYRSKDAKSIEPLDFFEAPKPKLQSNAETIARFEALARKAQRKREQKQNG